MYLFSENKFVSLYRNNTGYSIKCMYWLEYSYSGGIIFFKTEIDKMNSLIRYNGENENNCSYILNNYEYTYMYEYLIIIISEILRNCTELLEIDMLISIMSKPVSARGSILTLEKGKGKIINRICIYI